MTDDTTLSENDEPTDLPDSEPKSAEEKSGDDVRQKIEELQKTAETLKDQLLRKAAELENVKRRSEAETLTTIQYANESLLDSLIPVLEDFSRSFKAAGKEGNGESFAKGIELIHQKLARILAHQGLAPFDSVGKPFDVNYHDALLQMPRADVPPGTVIEEIERGYMFRDRVLRHAKVIVSSSPADEEQDSGKGHDA
jgi:molecular chaperone GrpE